MRTWLTKRLGYFVDDAIPVRWSRKSVSRTTPSDIDLICTHPRKQVIDLIDIGLKLHKNLLIECKGWFDYSIASSELLNGFKNDLDLMGVENVIPETASKKKDGFMFGILKKEVYDKAYQIYGSYEFQRLIIIPKIREKLKKRDGSVIIKKEILNELLKKGIIVIEIDEIIKDLSNYLKLDESKDQRRKNFVLELIHLLEVSGYKIN